MKKIPKVILLLNASGEYTRGLLRGIAKYSNLHGPWVFYNESGSSEFGKIQNLPQLRNWGADGIIAHIPDKRTAKDVMAMNLPTVLANEDIPIKSPQWTRMTTL